MAEPRRRLLLGSGPVNIISASAVMSRDNRRAAGSGVATLSGSAAAMNTRYVTYINRGTVFSVMFVQNLYVENRNTSQ
jgi:hypothetical protein